MKEKGSITMDRRELNIKGRRIKKAEKKMKEMKASTEEMRNEMTHLINLAENCHNAFLQIREAVNPLILAAQSLDAQVDELVSAFLAQNHGD